MTEEEARVRLEFMLAASTEPALDAEEVRDLLQMSKRADGEGRAPSDDDWVPTFDLYAAAAEGWRRKAGKVVPRFSVTLDGETLQRQQVYMHCMSQAATYANKIVGSVPVRSLTEATDEQIENIL